jgi:hypothetical protein
VYIHKKFHINQLPRGLITSWKDGNTMFDGISQKINLLNGNSWTKFLLKTTNKINYELCDSHQVIFPPIQIFVLLKSFLVRQPLLLHDTYEASAAAS